MASEQRTPPRWLGPLLGLVTAGVALGAAHLVAGLVGAAASPVIAVGEAAIDVSPTGLKSFAIRSFGANDKQVLLAGIGVVLVLASIVIGDAAVRRPRNGWIGLGVLAGIGALAVLTRPDATAVDLLPVAIGALAGAITFRLLLRAGGLTCPGNGHRAEAGGLTGRPRPAPIPLDRWTRRDRRAGCRRRGLVPRPPFPCRRVARQRADPRAHVARRRPDARDAGRRRGHQRVLHAEQPLLPGRHGAADAGRHRRGLAAAHPRHGRSRADAHLRRRARDAADRARHHACMRLQPRRRPLHRERPVDRRAACADPQGCRRGDRRRPAGGEVGGRVHRRHADGRAARRSRRDAGGRDERRAAPDRPRLPGTRRRPRPLRLCLGDEVGRRHGAHHVRRLRRLLDPARLGAAGADQGGVADRRAAARVDHGGSSRHRGRRVGAARRHRTRSRCRSTTGPGNPPSSRPRTPWTHGGNGAWHGTRPSANTACQFVPRTTAARPRRRCSRIRSPTARPGTTRSSSRWREAATTA